MTDHYIHLDKNGPHSLDKHAWWNMITSVYNFLSASTALAQALDEKYINDTTSLTDFICNEPLALEGIKEVDLVEYPFFVKLISEAQELSEISPNAVQDADEDQSFHCNVTNQYSKHKKNNINDNKEVERALVKMHEHEDSVNENFEKKLESIYSEWIRTSKHNLKLTDSSSHISLLNTLADSPTKVTDTECETLGKFLDGSCCSLYSNSDKALSSGNLQTRSDLPFRLSSSRVLNSLRSSKAAINFTGNTPESFPITEIEVPPNRTAQDEDNRSLVTWLTASTPYTKEASQSFVKDCLNNEQVQTTTNRRFNESLRAQITKEKQKLESGNEIAEAIDELVPKSIEELRRQLAFIRLCRQHCNNQDINDTPVKKTSKRVTELGQQTSKISTQSKISSSNERVKGQTRRKAGATENFKKVTAKTKKQSEDRNCDSLTYMLTAALSSKEKFENNKLSITKQIRCRTSRSKNTEDKKAIKKSVIIKDNNNSKSETNNFQLEKFSSGMKVVNRTSAQNHKDKNQVSRMGLVKKNIPTSSKVNNISGKTAEEVKLPKSVMRPFTPSTSIKTMSMDISTRHSNSAK